MTATTDWIGAIGTVGTLTTGLILFAGTIADRRRAHANAVSVWTELDVIDREAFELKLDARGSGPAIESRVEIGDWSNLAGPFEYRLRVKNGGNQPIYACRLHVELSGDGRPSGAYPIVYNSLSLNLGILGPEAEMPAQPLLVGAPHAGQDFSGWLVKAMSFELLFTDTAGRAWSRDQNGHLNRARGPRLLRRREARASRTEAVPDSAERSQIAERP
jgi:hypothetical protein